MKLNVVRKFDQCTKALSPDDVLQDVKIPPTCVLNQPGFRINCLENTKQKLEKDIANKDQKKREFFHYKSAFYNGPSI